MSLPDNSFISGEEYDDDFNTYSVSKVDASRFIGISAEQSNAPEDGSVLGTERFSDTEILTDMKVLEQMEMFPGSDLDGDTSLEMYMKASDLISPLKEKPDDGMQFIPTSQLNESITYNSDFEDDELDLMSLEISEHQQHQQEQQPATNESTDNVQSTVATASRKSTARKSSAMSQSQSKPHSVPSEKTSIIRRRATVTKVAGPSIQNNPTISPRPPPSIAQVPLKAVFQYHVPAPVVKAVITKDMKLSTATLESQLASALKKLEAYSKMNKILVRKLDVTSVNQELGRYKVTLNQQDEIISRLVEENKVLKKIVRDQERQINEHERIEGAEGVVISVDGQLKAMTEKLRKVHQHLSESRQKEAEKIQELEALTTENKKLSRRLAGTKSELNDLKSQVLPEESLDSSLSRRSSSPVKMKQIRELEEKLEKANEKNYYLEKQLVFYKNDFDKKISSMKTESVGYLEKIAELEKEVDAKTRLSRVQVVEVKRLQQICRDLAEGNKKLHLASDMYSGPVQPRPPSQQMSMSIRSHARSVQTGASKSN